MRRGNKFTAGKTIATGLCATKLRALRTRFIRMHDWSSPGGVIHLDDDLLPIDPALRRVADGTVWREHLQACNAAGRYIAGERRYD